MELKLFGVDEFKDYLAIFYIDRGDDLNAYVWVYENGYIRISDIYAVASFCNHSVSPLYVGNDMPTDLVDKAYDYLAALSGEECKKLIDRFNERDQEMREDEDKYDERKEYENAILKDLKSKADSEDGKLWLM